MYHLGVGHWGIDSGVQTRSGPQVPGRVVGWFVLWFETVQPRDCAAGWLHQHPVLISQPGQRKKVTFTDSRINFVVSLG